MLWMQLLLAPVPPTGPSPWNAVTITTAIVSVAALLLAGLTFWLNYWRGRVRKPRWAHGWEMQDNGTLNFWLSNRGAGLGLDARVTAREGEYASQSNLGNVEYSKGQSHYFHFDADETVTRLNAIGIPTEESGPRVEKPCEVDWFVAACCDRFAAVR